MMVAKAYIRGLIFIYAKSRAGRVLIVVLGQVSTFRFVLLDIHINTVLWRKLLLGRQGKLPLIDVVIRALAGVGMIRCLKVITEIPERPELRARLRPGSAAEIFRAGNGPKAVALEQRGIFLL